jgi:hypothetical protein
MAPSLFNFDILLAQHAGGQFQLFPAGLQVPGLFYKRIHQASNFVVGYPTDAKTQVPFGNP